MKAYRLIRKAEEDGLIHGVKICPGAPSITHLFFIDDALFVVLEDTREAITLSALLNTYEEISRQKLNLQKSMIYFNKNVNPGGQEIFSNLMGIPRVEEHGKYLGLSSMVGRAKKRCFSYIKGRARNKISGWKENLLSVGGKEVLLKSVTQVISTYAMSIIKLPKKLFDETEILMNRYWWGSTEDGGIKWMMWRRLCRPKSSGGMSFRSLREFN